MRYFKINLKYCIVMIKQVIVVWKYWKGFGVYFFGVFIFVFKEGMSQMVIIREYNER